jgi:hypothetical protein
MYERLFNDSADDPSGDLFIVEGLQECIREWSINRYQ